MVIDNYKDEVLQHIQQHNIKTVIISVNDNSNVNRSRFVSIEHFLDKVMDNGLGLSSAVFAFDTRGELNEDINFGYAGGFPSWIIRPDMTTFSIVPYLPNTARVIGDLYYANSDPIEFSPRQLLRRVISKYSEAGITVKGAFEYEFFVYKKNNGDMTKPIFSSKQCYSEVHNELMLEVIRNIMHNLAEIGAGPEIANTEYALGQLEITNSPFLGMEIADMATYYCMSIKEIVAQMGLVATFMAKPHANQSGSGAHLHLSLYDNNGDNLFWDEDASDGLSKVCKHFIGGQIKYAKPLCCLANPTVNSYKRLEEFRFAPTSLSWGYEHRGAMLRIPYTRGENTRVENKLLGSDTNPYIALASILAAGLDGIKNETDPPEPCTGDTTYEDKYERLPRTLYEAIVELRKDQFFLNVLGKDFITQYLQLREHEWYRYMAHISDWEYEEYLNQQI